MTETLKIPDTASKEELYRALLPQIAAVIDGVDDLIANLANTAAILKQAFDFYWVGFYRVTSPEKLTLGPFQGPLACVMIPFSKRRLRCGGAGEKNHHRAGCRRLSRAYRVQQPDEIRNRRAPGP